MTIRDTPSEPIGGFEFDTSLYFPPPLQPKPLTPLGRNRLRAREDRGPVDPLHHPEIADSRRLRLSVAEQCALEGTDGDDTYDVHDTNIIDDSIGVGVLPVIGYRLGAPVVHRLGEF